MQRPQTIQIFLPDGNPTSIKIADLTNRMMTAVLFPRNKLVEVGVRDEVKKYGVYFLFGYSDEKAKPICYIGETEDCYERIKTHNKNKDFWYHAIVITSKSNTFTKSHVKYLEYLCIKNANEISRFDTENLATPAKPYITESMEADLLDNYDTVKILLATLGYPIFEEIKKSLEKKKEILFCKGKDASAEGDMVDDGFVVFKGSVANREESNTAGTWSCGMRKKIS
ncbi:MAG: GIY-YIG nuclease family protein [Bacteroidetes bacterium]|nr:GIY-YIG nuclease family protein [Bacteroidota bacterium]